MTSQFIRRISSTNATVKTVWGREKWKFISSWLACVLSGTFQVSSKFFRRLSTSGDLTLHKRLVLFLHHPHLKGWQRVHHSASSIWEGWHRSQSISFHIRGVRVSIWISREIPRGLMNIMVRRIMLIFIALRSSLRNRSVSTMMFIWGFWSAWGIWSIWGLGSIRRIWSIWRIRSGVPILHGWCHDDIHLKIFKTPFRNPDFFIGGPFQQLVPTYRANTSPFWFLNSL